jgi:hypothetical protein
MKKLFIFLMVAVSLLFSFGSASKSAADTNHSAIVDPLVTPTPLAEIERIELDKTEALYACTCIRKIPNMCGVDEKGEIKKDNLLIAVKTFVRNPKNKPLSYEYKISGGKIIGQGDKVVWDLEGFRPGTYTVTASIKGKRRISAETRTLSAVVSECDCDCPCVCPTLEVTGGGNVKAGETVSFKAEVSGGTAADITYDWTVSQGEIIEGQGTSEIKVKTTAEMTGTITANVEIGGDGFCADCPRTDSETATIIK